ncbi:nuclear transport factor 2 family protein [Pyxidicoccus fallax]|uniref:Nuclear transport factor 2 family protein n=1 Tax=Pyxidicoccus fallax TaxID=394095 RepID=A0A848L9H7_9BACT|nr:nuclear transport factor 2 family protein [Pyxidicoccus fallax]NMO13505.1 nuclear transport factor 2 family protein [Pyxidicoccus fallax]NPC78544.1 nuclear transport factor 2 family protein [Pyxidicoccus fallax]
MSTANTATQQIRKQAQQTFSNHLEYLSSGRISEWVDLFAEDGVLEFPYGPEGFPKKVTGKGELYAYMKNFPRHFQVRFTGLRFHETTDPSLVVAEFSSEGKALETGRPYNQTYISLVETRDGKITRYVDFWNPLVAMKAMGAENISAAYLG